MGRFALGFRGRHARGDPLTPWRLALADRAGESLPPNARRREVRPPGARGQGNPALGRRRPTRRLAGNRITLVSEFWRLK